MTYAYRRPHDSPNCTCSGCEAFDRKLSPQNDRCGCCGQPTGAPHIVLGGGEAGFKRCPNDPDQSDPNGPTGCDSSADPPKVEPPPGCPCRVCNPHNAMLAEDDGWRPWLLARATCGACGCLVLRLRGAIDVMCSACAANGGKCPPPAFRIEAGPLKLTPPEMNLTSIDRFTILRFAALDGASDIRKLADAMSAAAETGTLEDWPGTDVR
jgi:hypothetical protein